MHTYALVDVNIRRGKVLYMVIMRVTTVKNTQIIMRLSISRILENTYWVTTESSCSVTIRISLCMSILCTLVP